MRAFCWCRPEPVLLLHHIQHLNKSIQTTKAVKPSVQSADGGFKVKPRGRRDGVPARQQTQLRSLEEFELAHQWLHGLFGIRLQSQTRGDVLGLLDPQLVGHAGLGQALRQSREGSLVRSLQTEGRTSSMRRTATA